MSAERQPRWKQDQLAKHMTEKFAPIMTLCNDILAKSTPTTLANAALESLQRFLTWVPAEMVFNLSHGESQSKDSLIHSLCMRVLLQMLVDVSVTYKLSFYVVSNGSMQCYVYLDTTMSNRSHEPQRFQQ